jgi:hypothetical protein
MSYEQRQPIEVRRPLLLAAVRLRQQRATVARAVPPPVPRLIGLRGKSMLTGATAAGTQQQQHEEEEEEAEEVRVR